ncbi:WD40 repeat domain-containing protein [Gemmata sp. JC717]|uniref:WD40 repeat domain-containing protein n=1 Tax=Gemmata algarum TaxID=2975278 RepID=UPI0021BB87B8|nr:WD40 repeat domain-containing protein [Gemmata algarum]MDY3554650.1 WD40 repeat domain-containing protein [Gemmata algarum]
MDLLRLYSIVAVGLVALAARPGAVRSAPVKERQVFLLVAGGSVQPDDLSIRDLAIVDENTVVVVGTTFDKDDDTNPINLGPNGAIVDLTKKTSRPFTNGHKSCICTAAVGRGRVATISTTRDPFLRLWDLKTSKSAGAVQIDEPDGDGSASGHEVGLFHKSDRVAVSVKDRVLLFDPDKPDTRTELACPEGCGWPDHPIVSPDDARIAATATWSNLIVWDVATKKPQVVSLAPDQGDPKHWMSRGCVFGPNGLLIAWRSPSGNGDVPRAKGEDVPGDRCEVVRIDGDKVVPLGIGGNSFDVFDCALDPSGTWLAVAGCRQLDKPLKDGSTSVGELRVYHLGTKELAFREQVEGLPLTHVAFAPSGKRVVCCTYDGFVRWWNVKGK